MFVEFRREVEHALREALSDLGYPTDDLGIEEPPEDVDAVLASSVAYRLAGEAGAPPPEVAREVADQVRVDRYEYVGRVVPEGPYVNLLVSDRYYRDTVVEATREGYGRLPDRGERAIVEHTSANPTGPVHVGRARNPIVGDSLRRILDFAGYDVETHYYVNDAGRQVAILAWAHERFDEDDLPDPDREKSDYDLVRYYRAGNEFLEDAEGEQLEAAEAEITAIIEGLEAGDEATYERVEPVVEGMLSGMQETLDRLGAPFDRFVHETEFMRDGSTDELVDRLKQLEEAVYEDDAWQLDLSAHGIEKNLVFLRSDGTSLYPTRDLAHHEWKLGECDRAVTVLGEDHQLQARQLRTTLELLGVDTDTLDQVFHSWVTLPGGEGMSTRAGTGVDLDDLLDEATERARREVEDRIGDRDRGDELDEADVDRIARQVGVGAVRYDVVAKQPTKAITFDWDRALDFEAQSAPYVQYVHARACGILDRADVPRVVAHPEAVVDDDPGYRTAPGHEGRDVGEESEADEGAPDGSDAGDDADADADADPDADAGAGSGTDRTVVDPDLLSTPEERALLETVARFPAVVEEAAEDLEPHRIATYTRTFAERFNDFYRSCRVLDDDVDPAVREARLALVAAARETVANALSLLGVEAPESM